MLKNWCFWTVVLEKTLESTLACKEIQSVHPKGSQYWIFIGRTDVEAQTPVLWPLDEKNWLTGKDHDSGKDWRWKDKGPTEDEIWMASPTWWTWVWASSVRWWRTGKPGALQFTGSQRVRLDWVTELNWFKGLEQKEYVLICFGITSFPQTLIRTSSAHPPQCKTKGERKFSKNSLDQICWMALLPKCEMPTSGFYIQ